MLYYQLFMKKYITFLLQPLITRSFIAKLKHNFHTLTPFEMLVYFVALRPFWSKQKRFFFEGSIRLMGQMYLAERKSLYETVITYKPRQCFEIGTYTGGGSTFFLGSALSCNNFGTLYTIENNTHCYNKARNYFAKKLPKINKHIQFMFSDTAHAFDQLVNKYDKVDFVFFDGAEEGSQTLEQYNYFLPYFKKGSIIAFHDWSTEKTISVKPIVTIDSSWKKLTELTPPHSIGFAVFIRE